MIMFMLNAQPYNKKTTNLTVCYCRVMFFCLKSLKNEENLIAKELKEYQLHCRSTTLMSITGRC